MDNLKEYRDMGFFNHQLNVIDKALKSNLDRSLIRKYIINPSLDNMQMEVILDGLLNDLDVELFCSPEIKYEQMKEIYLKLLEEKNLILNELRNQKLTKKSIKISKILYNSFIFSVIILILIVLYIVVYPIYQKQNENLEIVFNNDFVRINYNDDFNIKDNIKSYTNKDKYEIILPEIKLNKLGQQNIELTLSNGFKKIKKSFILEIIDKVKPVLELSVDDKEIYEKEIEDFNCNNYIRSVSDNFDNLKISDVKCDYQNLKIGDNKIIYSIKDSSNNYSEKTLTLNVLENPKPKNLLNDNSYNSMNNQSSKQDNINTQKSSDPFILGIKDISVSSNSSLSDLVYELTKSISASSVVSVDYSSVNLSIQGSYPVFYYGQDGASAQITVYVN